MNVTGIVLAGGRSARFGGAKLDADIDGVSLLGWTIRSITGLADEILVAGPSLPPELAGGTLRQVADAEPFAGPLAALAGTLGRARGSVAVVVGGDMPGLVPVVLQAMLDRLELDPTVDAVLLGDPGASRQVLPLGLRVSTARSASAAAVADGERSLRALVDRLRSAEIPASAWRALDPTGRTLLDVDTQSDLDRLRRLATRHDHG